MVASPGHILESTKGIEMKNIRNEVGCGDILCELAQTMFLFLHAYMLRVHTVDLELFYHTKGWMKHCRN